jgi:serine/threonine protein phosphatase PrpC
VRAAWLRGRDHSELGAIETRAEGIAALALSIGGAKKVYAHTDPNEDGALFALGREGALLAVADGHGGADASEAALGCVLQTLAPPWTSSPRPLRGAWEEEALSGLAACEAAIVKGAASGGRRLSRTTLAIGLVRPAEGLLFFASIGDSHLYEVRRDSARDLAGERSRSGRLFFLGGGHDSRAALRERCVLGAEALAGLRAVVLATDGLSERGVGVDDPALTVARVSARAARAPETQRALETSRSLVNAALEAHRHNTSGDNVAAAVAWLEPFPELRFLRALKAGQ